MEEQLFLLLAFRVQVTQVHYLVVEAVVVIYPVLNPTIQQLILSGVRVVEVEIVLNLEVMVVAVEVKDILVVLRSLVVVAEPVDVEL